MLLFKTRCGGFLPVALDKRDEDQLHRGFMLLELEPFTSTIVPPVRFDGAEPPRAGIAVKTVPDKLILRSGSQPGAAMVMLDLYASGSHAHEYKRPSIGYYEVAGVPLFHNLGRRGMVGNAATASGFSTGPMLSPAIRNRTSGTP